MKHVLCYGDSNTYGHDPQHGGARMSEDKRWTGALSCLLGPTWRVIEEGLCGRTTALEDPTIPGCNGLSYLLPCLRSHAPLDWVIIMLGTNDLQCVHNMTPDYVAMNVERLGRAVLDSSIQIVVPRLLIVSPILIGDVRVDPYFNALFGHALDLSAQLGPLLRDVSKRLNCEFLDASTVAEASTLDGLHMDSANHLRLAKAIASILWR